MNFDNPNQGYSDSQINAAKKKLFESGRNLHALESNPSFQHGQALIKLMMEGVVPEADKIASSPPPALAAVPEPPKLKNYGGQWAQDWMDVDVSKIGPRLLSDHFRETSPAFSTESLNPQADFFYNQFVNPASRSFKHEQPQNYIGEDAATLSKISQGIGDFADWGVSVNKGMIETLNDWSKSGQDLYANMGKSFIKPIRDSIGDYRHVGLMQAQNEYPYEQKLIDRFGNENDLNKFGWLYANPATRPLYERMRDQAQNGTVGKERNLAFEQNRLNDAEVRLNQFRESTALNYTPDQNFQGSVADFGATMAGEAVRNIGGYAVSPLAGTPTLNSVMSQQIPAYQKRGLDFSSAYDRAWWNGATDMRNVLDLPVVDKFTKGAKGAMALGEFGLKHADEATAAAFRQYGRDINPASLVNNGLDRLKTTPIVKNVGGFVDRSNEILGDVWGKVANSRAGQGLADVVPADVVDKALNFARRARNEVPSRYVEDKSALVMDNIQRQRIGEDVGTFDQTIPDFNTLKKSGIDTVVEVDIWNWWRGLWD